MSPVPASSGGAHGAHRTGHFGRGLKDGPDEPSGEIAADPSLPTPRAAVHDLLDRLLHLDRAMLAALSRLTTPAAGPGWHELDPDARDVRTRWLARRVPVTVLATLLLSLLGTTPGATAGPLGVLGAFVVAMAPLGLLAAAYLHRFGRD